MSPAALVVTSFLIFGIAIGCTIAGYLNGQNQCNGGTNILSYKGGLSV